MKTYCTMTTPEGRKHVFKVPDNAPTDSRGFYLINENFRKNNPDMNFAYLAHDLIYRGLNKSNNFTKTEGE